MLSITNKGSLLACKDEPPRIRILVPAPAVPPSVLATTPGAFPISNSCGDVIVAWLKSFAEIAVIEPVASVFLTSPYPIPTTSTSLNTLDSSFNAIFKYVWSNTFTSTFE